MKLFFASFAIVIWSIVDPAFASGVRPGNLAPVMIAPLLLAGVLSLVVGVLICKHHESAIGFLAGVAVLFIMVVASRLLAKFGFIVALFPQTIVGIAVLLAWRKEARRS